MRGSRKRLLWLARLLAPAAVIAAYAIGCGRSAHETEPALLRAPELRPLDALGVAAADPMAALPRGTSLIAEAKGRSVRVYAHRHDAKARRSLRNPNPDGAPLVFLVRYARRHWIQAYLPTRPNGSRGWVKASAVSLAQDPYELRVNLSRHRLILRVAGKRTKRMRIGVGRALTPTPSGTYFITELLEQPNPHGLYGPYAFGLSAHSSVLHEFAGANGIVGIHGTNYPRGIGTNVSHGCIRMSNRDIVHLAKVLPLGTRVQIRR